MYNSYLDIKRQFVDCLRYIVALYKSGTTDPLVDQIAFNNRLFKDYWDAKKEDCLIDAQDWDWLDADEEMSEIFDDYKDAFTLIKEEESQGRTCCDNKESDNAKYLDAYQSMLFDVLRLVEIFFIPEKTMKCYDLNIPKEYSLSTKAFYDWLCSSATLLDKIIALKSICPGIDVLNTLLTSIENEDYRLFTELIEKYNINCDFASKVFSLFYDLGLYSHYFNGKGSLEEELSPESIKPSDFPTYEDYITRIEEYRPYVNERNARWQNKKDEIVVMRSTLMHNLHKNEPELFRSLYVTEAIIELTIYRNILTVEEFYNYGVLLPTLHWNWNEFESDQKEGYQYLLAVYYLSIRNTLNEHGYVIKLVDEWIETPYFEPISKDYIEEILKIKDSIGDMPIDEIPAYLETVGSDSYVVVHKNAKTINKPTIRRKYLDITFEDRNKIINLAKILSDPKASCCFIDAKDVKAFVYILCGPNPNDNYVPENKIKWNFHYSTHYYMLKQLYHKKKYTTIPPGVSDDIVSNFEFYTKKNQPSAQSYITNGNKSYFKNKYANEIEFIEKAIKKAFA